MSCSNMSLLQISCISTYILCSYRVTHRQSDKETSTAADKSISTPGSVSQEGMSIYNTMVSLYRSVIPTVFLFDTGAIKSKTHMYQHKYFTVSCCYISALTLWIVISYSVYHVDGRPVSPLFFVHSNYFSF